MLLKHPSATATICQVHLGDEGERKSIYDNGKEERQATQKK